MQTKYKFLGLFIFLLLLSFNISAATSLEVSIEDKEAIRENINIIANTLNTSYEDILVFPNIKNMDPILNIISPNADETLRQEIIDNYSDVITFTQRIKSYKYLSEDIIEVKGNFSAEGMNWSVSGFNNNFIFEKIDGNWLLLDTDFHLKFGFSYVLKSVWKIFLILIPIFLVCFAFWLWMLIDIINRSFKDKVLWIILMIVLGVLGSILYFFIIRRKLKREKKDIENN
jgi:hypothetical protein